MSQCPACNAEIVTYEPQLKRFHDGARGEHSGTAVCPLKVVLLPVHREGQGAPAGSRRNNSLFIGRERSSPPDSAVWPSPDGRLTVRGWWIQLLL